MKPIQRPIATGLLFASLIALGGCGEPSETASSEASGSGAVLATVNGAPLYESELQEYVSGNQINLEGNDEQRKQVIDELVMRKLVMQDAVSQGIDKKPEIVRQVNETRDRLVLNEVIGQALKASPVTDEELQAEYDKQLSQFDVSELKARHILVEDEAKAVDLIAQLDKGADFAALAKEHSTGPTGKDGGDLGWFAPQQMVPPFAEAAQALEKGKYTKEPVQTQFGWHVILLEDTRKAEPPAFDEVKQQLTQRVQQMHIRSYLDGLKEKAKISLN